MRRLTHTARRRICALALLLLTPTLCACSDLRQERRELEQMQIIQTVGVDYAPGGVRLSLAAAAGPEGQGTAPALPLDNETYLTLSDCSESISRHSEFDKVQ